MKSRPFPTATSILVLALTVVTSLSGCDRPDVNQAKSADFPVESVSAADTNAADTANTADSGPRASIREVGSQNRIEDLDGNPVAWPSLSPGRIKAFVFTRTDCPIANRYAPEIARLAAEFGSKGVDFFTVYVDPEESADLARQHAADYSLPQPAFRDPRHALVDRCEIEVTPEVTVFLTDGRMIYRGRIDDRVEDFGKAHLEPGQRDLYDLLTRVTAGDVPEAMVETRAIGCYIQK